MRRGYPVDSLFYYLCSDRLVTWERSPQEPEREVPRSLSPALGGPQLIYLCRIVTLLPFLGC